MTQDHSFIKGAKCLRYSCSTSTCLHAPKQTSSYTTRDIMAATQKDEKAIAHAKTLANVPWHEQYERMISGML